MPYKFIYDQYCVIKNKNTGMIVVQEYKKDDLYYIADDSNNTNKFAFYVARFR